MFKSTIVAAILATATSFAVAQTTAGAPATSTGVTEGASQSNVANAATKSSKHAKSKKSMKSSSADSSAASAPVTGATGTTAAGTPGMSTSGATKPASDTTSH